MIKKFLNIYTEKGGLNVVVRTKSDQYNRYREIFDFDDSEFTISDSKVKFEILEMINVELYQILETRVDPPKPKIQYVPLSEMYTTKSVFRKDFKFLQGNEIDNNILLLLNLRTLLEESIINNKELRGDYVSTIRECESPS